MIDELMDSLVLDRLPTLEGLDATLTELCRGAEDIEPILHSFKNSQHLRVGVRDILGKEDIRDTHRALSDIAEVCLKHVAQSEYPKLVERFGEPSIKGGARDGGVCDFVILAMGKLGGREPNYHSDLDVVFLFEADGMTRHRRPDKGTTNQHFFGELGQRIIKVMMRMGPYGRLYEVDPRLRPTGKSGTLATSLAEFTRYFAEGQGQQWELQALCKARTVFGSETARQNCMKAVHEAICELGWCESTAGAIRSMRYRLEETASRHNLKRGPGGTVDVEFAVQMLQLKHAAQSPEVLVPGTLDAISALHGLGYLSDEDNEFLQQSYRFMRSIEARLRLMNTAARHEIPQEESDLKKLAFLLEFTGGPNHLLEKTHKSDERKS